MSNNQSDDILATTDQGSLMVSILEVELTRINLKENEVLAVSIRSDEVDEYTLDILKSQMKKVFPKNKVMVFGLGSNYDVNFTAISSPEPKGYCDDCSCGKKESYAKVESAPLSEEEQKVLDDMGDEYLLREADKAVMENIDSIIKGE